MLFIRQHCKHIVGCGIGKMSFLLIKKLDACDKKRKPALKKLMTSRYVNCNTIFKATTELARFFVLCNSPIVQYISNISIILGSLSLQP